MTHVDTQRFAVADGQTEVVLGAPWRSALPSELAARGVRRVVILASPGRRSIVQTMVAALEATLGAGRVATFLEAAQHVPRPLAERALDEVARFQADAIVAIGGGSAIGLGKAVALLRSRAGLPPLTFACLPTTYAGSEMTAIWGLGRATGPGKEVGRDAAVRPSLVLYDPALSAELPEAIAIPSAFNAMAHAVDALFPLEGAREPAELAELAQLAELAELAEMAIVELAAGIDQLHRDPDDAGGRLRLLAGAQKAGEILDRAGMSLHHKLAHVLGGRFSLPHAPTHTVLLPHVIAFMAPAAPRAIDRLARAFGDTDPAAALDQLQARVGAPQRLDELGLSREQVEAAVDEVATSQTSRKIESPRTIEAATVRELVLDAWLGRRPSIEARRLDAPSLTGSSHAGLRPALAGARLEDARAAIVCVHGRGGTAEAMVAKLEHLLGGLPDGLAVVAIQAARRSWYPHGFAEPVDRNQPELDDALELLAAVRERVGGHVPASRILLFGFSQGACLVLDHLARRGGPTAGAIAIAGGLIGAQPCAPWHDARLDADNGVREVRVVVGVAAHDRWVPRARVEATAARLESLGAVVERHFVDGDEHTITEDQAASLRALVHATLQA